MKFCKTDKEIVFSEVQNQFIAVVCANLMAVAHGGLMGWFSPAVLVLESDDSPIGKLSKEDSSWLASISFIGGFIGTFFFMQTIKIFGRKITFLILAVPNFIFWLAIIFSKHISYLYAARFFGGFVGGGAYISIPLLVTEIAEDHVRGILGSMLMIFANVGVMMAYVTGTYMGYDKAPIAMMVFPIGVFVSFLFIPDTPKSLLDRNKSEAAIEKSLLFYLNIKDKSTEYNKTRYENALESVMLWGENKKTQPKLSWKDLTARNAVVGFAKSLAMVFFSIFCGSPVLQNYSSVVFKESGSSMDPSLSAIIMIVIQVAATIIATTFVDNVGRRMLLIFSSMGTTFGLTAMGTYNYLAINYDLKGFDWVPIASISFTVFLAYIGLLPLVFVIIMEVLPAKVRESYATICLSCVSLFMFIVVKFYPLASLAYNMYSCMWFFAAVSLLSFLFGVFILEETKGKRINEL